MSELSDESLEAINYMDSAYSRSFKLGKYEPANTVMDYLENGTYWLADTQMGILDPVWGKALIGDKPHDDLLIELARTPLFRRTQAIEQLTLGPEYATVPNSMYFSRWQHIWGSLAFVRNMTEIDSRFDDRQRMVLQLRTLVSDLGHTAFSHLGDWIFQGPNGGEDMHDEELKQILEITGIGSILEKHNFTIDEVAFPNVEDWVECPSPDLCVDRVDYSLRELVRWADTFLHLSEFKNALHDPKTLFEITPDNQLALKNEKFAKVFAAGFALLPTEHWGHPVHRLQLQLLENTVKSVLTEDIAGQSEHPRDAMYGIDSDFDGYFKAWDIQQFDKLMRDIAYSQRYIFSSARRNDLNNVLQVGRSKEWNFPEFPDPLKAYSWQSREHAGPYAAQVDVVESTVALTGLRATARGIELSLPPLKARSIDPLVAHGGGYKRLSEIDSTYVTYLEGQKAMMNKAYKATILVRPAVAQSVEKRYIAIQEEWQKTLVRKRNPEHMRARIQDAEGYAAGHRFDAINETDDSHVRLLFQKAAKLAIDQQ